MEIVNFFSKYIALFIDSKKAISNSKNSLRSYNYILERFLVFIGNEAIIYENLSIFDINRYFLNNYIIYLNNEKLSKRSQHQHILIIKHFLNFIADSDLKLYKSIKENITGVKVKYVENEATSFNLEEQTKIITLIKKLDTSSNFTANRNAVILKILLFHGVRINELLNLKWQDISEEYSEEEGYVYRLKYIGKGLKERTLDFPINFLDKNFIIIKKHLTSIYVVPSYNGQKLEQGNVFRSIKKLLHQEGVFKQGLHIFRHTFGDNNASMNINLAVMSKLMGHSNIATTAKYYVRVNDKTKREAIFKVIDKNFGSI